MTYVLQFLIAMSATLAFAVLFAAPKKELVFCGLSGALAWLVYYGVWSGSDSTVFASFLATLGLTVFCRAVAVARQNPATIYLVCGIFPLVPGAGIYYTTSYLIAGDGAACAAKGLETFEIALAIVFGILFGFSLPEALFHRREHGKGERA